MNEGFEVIWIKNAMECAKALRHTIPTILIVDADLPWGSGLGILALMKDGELPSVPVLLLMNPDDELPHSLSAPMEYAILFKPVDSLAVADAAASLRVIARHSKQSASSWKGVHLVPPEFEDHRR